MHQNKMSLAVHVTMVGIITVQVEAYVRRLSITRHW